MSGPLQYLHAEDPTDAPATGDVPVFGSTGYVPTAGVNGNVTAAGTLTSNQVVIGQGTKAVATLGSLGTTTTVLHGNAAGAPTFATVVEADITLADNTTNNCSTSAHGFLKKLDNNSAHFMDGQGNWSTPAGSGGNVSAAGTLTSNAIVIGQGAQDVAVLGSLGTTTTLLHGNAAGAPTFAQVSLTADVTGVLPVANGGTRLVQQVNTQTGAKATGTTTIPIDDTIPQNTEGNEYMTLAITPTSSSNKLKIDVVAVLASSTVGGNTLITALFQDSTSDAIAADVTQTKAAGDIATTAFSHYMTAGTTSATTFKVRSGGSGAGTTTFNGSGGNRFLGGVLASSITITEYAP